MEAPKEIFLGNLELGYFSDKIKFSQEYDGDIKYIRADLVPAAPEWVSAKKNPPEVFDGHAQAYQVLFKRYKEETIYQYGIGYCWPSGWEVDNSPAIVAYYGNLIPTDNLPPEAAND